MNNDLDKLTIGSNKKVWWICDKGHSYDQVIRSKVKGICCPICSNKKVWWKCSKCGNEWEASIYKRNSGTGCPKCRKNLSMNKKMV